MINYKIYVEISAADSGGGTGGSAPEMMLIICLRCFLCFPEKASENVVLEVHNGPWPLMTINHHNTIYILTCDKPNTRAQHT